jgi:hypothetical protein
VGLCSSTGKRCYPDKVSAQVDNQHLPSKIHTYRCLDCGYVHITRGRDKEHPSIYDLLMRGDG